MIKFFRNFVILFCLPWHRASPFTATLSLVNRVSSKSNDRTLEISHRRSLLLVASSSYESSNIQGSNTISASEQPATTTRSVSNFAANDTDATKISVPMSSSTAACPKLRRLKDRLWVRETLEDLTTAEFACRVEQHTPEISSNNKISNPSSLAPLMQRKERAVDFENILGKLERRLNEMCVLDSNSSFAADEETTPAAMQKSRYKLIDGRGLGSVVYTHQQREALLGKILSAYQEIYNVINKPNGGQVESNNSLVVADLDTIRTQLEQKDSEQVYSSAEQQQQNNISSKRALPPPRLYVREDGTVDWEGALQDQSALKLFGTAVWARINGQDPTAVSEGRIMESHSEHDTKAAVTAKIQETAAIREEREKLQTMQRDLSEVEELHTALLASAISAGAATANINLASLDPELRAKIRDSTTALEIKREQVLFQKLVYDLERIYVYLDGEIGNTRGGSVPLQDRLAVAEFGLLESQIESLRRQMDTEDDDVGFHSDVLKVIVDQVNDFKGRLGIDYYVTGLTFDQDAITRWAKDLWEQTKKGVAFYVKGCQLLWNDVVFCSSLIGRALQGYTLKPREVRTLRRTFKDILTFIPFVIILIIPLTPIGHVLVFGAIQRFFPDFFPSCFTERRQNLLELYERTEYSEVVIDETLKEKLARLAEAALFFVAEGSRRLWKIVTAADVQENEEINTSTTNDNNS
mmetsp:Transcript_3730/g.5580  ORF Transcript_3730/g.5580 Transcript_3730/m.5580 type:complete len:697 (-) Transcript_3730:783-2873(-)